MLTDDVNIGDIVLNVCEDVVGDDNVFVSNLLFFIGVGVDVSDVVDDIPLLRP